MNIVILGPQASGKGTQAKLLAKDLNFAYFEAGDILREKAKETSSLGKKINERINKEGRLVSDELMKKIVSEWLGKVEIKKGLIFDGYPRSLKQYQTLEFLLDSHKTQIDKVFYLKVSRQVSLERLSARRICPVCDLEYNLLTKPPKNGELCDVCREKLVQRPDDTPTVIKKRLAIYDKLTEPLINHAQNQRILEEINGERSIKAIHKDILKRVKT